MRDRLEETRRGASRNRGARNEGGTEKKSFLKGRMKSRWVGASEPLG